MASILPTSTVVISRSAWLKLYKDLQRSSAKIPHYSYRTFTKRRIREYFDNSRSETDSIRLAALYKKMTSIRCCPKCKTKEYGNRSLIMMINECGHSLCKNCVDNLFVRNSGPCPTCGRTLKKNNFWEQVFDDPIIERENHIRKKMRKIFNLHEDDFINLREYNDYLEQFEELVWNLSNDINVDECQLKIEKFRNENAELIERNRKRLTSDDIWMKQNLEDEKRMKSRINAIEMNVDNSESSNFTDARAIIEELKTSDLPAEVILDRQRKRQIEAALTEKHELAKRKKTTRTINESRANESIIPTTSTSSFAIKLGCPFVYQPFVLNTNGPNLPNIDDLEQMGYLQYAPLIANSSRLAGGFTTQLGYYRMLFECRLDLFNI